MTNDVEDERHLICHCPVYETERQNLRYQLIRIGLKNELNVLDDIDLFSVVMGTPLNFMPFVPLKKQRVMAMIYCRQFLTIVFRRRLRLLTRSHRAKNSGSQVIHQDLCLNADENINEEKMELN